MSSHKTLKARTVTVNVDLLRDFLLSGKLPCKLKMKQTRTHLEEISTCPSSRILKDNAQVFKSSNYRLRWNVLMFQKVDEIMILCTKC